MLIIVNFHPHVLNWHMNSVFECVCTCVCARVHLIILVGGARFLGQSGLEGGALTVAM